MLLLGTYHAWKRQKDHHARIKSGRLRFPHRYARSRCGRRLILSGSIFQTQGGCRDMWHDQLLKVSNEGLVDMWSSVECVDKVMFNCLNKNT